MFPWGRCCLKRFCGWLARGTLQKQVTLTRPDGWSILIYYIYSTKILLFKLVIKHNCQKKIFNTSSHILYDNINEFLISLLHQI